ncbi:RNA-binding S4 domain-containing protein [Acidaminobacter hydrogenoformans]|uniref:S4 domain-containing protein n=1 Tax=Acidaminobacter hydrogenoformans DSM 2784 TaxID=1120920 RepID=A0A1G5RS33_9FIRM|nr:RNA-binding S4 domain-containing protein [Acidaminobacter hydrogenoformans]SCZ76668.1 S4 domain-containing protein [Acidaminobacter hydrogenoformans DSM 2784]
MYVMIHTDFIKLDQLIKLSGLVQTGGYAKQVIADGLVKLNGEYEVQRGKKIRPGDKVEIEVRDESDALVETYTIEVGFGQEE